MTYVAYKNAFSRKMQFWSNCYTVVSYQTPFRLSVYKIPAVYLSGAKNVCFCTIRDFGPPTNHVNNGNILSSCKQLMDIFAIMQAPNGNILPSCIQPMDIFCHHANNQCIIIFAIMQALNGYILPSCKQPMEIFCPRSFTNLIKSKLSLFLVISQFSCVFMQHEYGQF